MKMSLENDLRSPDIGNIGDILRKFVPERRASMCVWMTDPVARTEMQETATPWY